MSATVATGVPRPEVAPDYSGTTREKGESREDFEQFIQNEYTRRMEERRIFESQWQLNITFIENNQYAEIHKVTGEIYVPEKRYPWELRDSFNHVAPIYETRLSKLNRNRTVMVAIPGSPEDSDVSSAKIATKLLAYNQDEQHMEEIVSEATAWSEATGTAFLKNIWNQDRGKFLPDPTDPQGGIFAIGDVETVVCSPFEILPHDILKPRLEDQFSLIHVKAWPIDSDHVQSLKELAKQTRGEEINVQAEDVQAVTIGRGFSVVSGTSIPKFAVQRLRDRVRVIEYYERPCRKYPKGRFAIVLSGKLVYSGQLPYQTDDEVPDLPFVKVDCIRRTNCFWSKSVVERLIPIQRRYNALRNRVAEYLNRVGIGQWTAEEGTVDIDMLTNEPGIVIEHSRGSRAPSPVVFTSLPGTFRDEISDLRREFEDISGVHEVSQGRVPSGANNPSGIMVAQLQEQDDTRISTTIRYLDTAISKTGKQWLQRYRQFAVERRAFPVVGRNNSIHMYHFDRTSLRSHNVKIQNTAALAMTPAARRETVLSLLDRGMFNDPQTGALTPEGKQKVWQMLEFGNWEDFDEDKAIPEARAMWENVLMSEGRRVNVHPWEDHLSHLSVLNRYRQTDEFYELLESEAGQQIAALFEQHAQAHMAFLTPQGNGAAQPNQSPPPAQTGEPDLREIARQAAEIQATQGAQAAEEFLRQQGAA